MAMLAELVAPDALAGPGATQGRVIVSRFGPIVVQADAAITFPSGLLGFAGLYLVLGVLFLMLVVRELVHGPRAAGGGHA